MEQERELKGGVLGGGGGVLNSSPHVGVGGVVLVGPGAAGVDALPIDLQPLARVHQPVLKDGQDPAVLRGAHVHQHVAAAAEITLLALIINNQSKHTRG